MSRHERPPSPSNEGRLRTALGSPTEATTDGATGGILGRSAGVRSKPPVREGGGVCVCVRERLGEPMLHLVLLG